MKNSTACTVRISGGLGNQMFQYAAARAVSLRTASTLVLDRSFYRAGRHRDFELDSLPIQANISSPGKLNQFWTRVVPNNRVYREPHFHFDAKVLELVGPAKLFGYFQSEKYFADQADAIRTELTPTMPVDASDTDQTLAKQIEDRSGVSLHVRRGDYVTNPKASQVYHACTMDYYQAAMEQIPGNDPVYVFSDDIEWARASLPKVKPLVFPSSETRRSGLVDLWLMTHAQHHIIANSTFSWWGAWLSRHPSGTKIAPRKWFADPSKNDQDLIPEKWLRV